MIDTHAHLNLSPLCEHPEEIRQKAQECHVNMVILPGVDLESSRKSIELSKTLMRTKAAIGIHPQEATATLNIKAIRSQFEAWLQNEEVVAIGECGLDYCELHDLPKEQAQVKRTLQRKLFGIHIQLAKQFNRPLLIHCRNTRSAEEKEQEDINAYTDNLDTLRHFSTTDGIIPSFVLHCMSGSVPYLEEALHMGGYISFAGNVTYKNAQHIRDLLHATPLGRLLLETDSPFLSPQSKRGTSNEPANIKETYESVAKELNMSFHQLEHIVEVNAHQLFHI
ncbi:hypothetical protein C5B42_05830 [Candidatus Cerribacteria bacterium 'Amazon FNV 2010 28 9']|uniref:Hydrolase TatD n=1 Tax=Candidatus Cerribacteria bacterium 'Amazon FNV 2010 28 9' TaxID=2081795 RepID=A0A317JPM2_9BACT|nr:MAG: hypothetical protein C5B42_05830 [Candidatus Cerribacteria bacterium 'Amazon FNV 2010 28 9']